MGTNTTLVQEASPAGFHAIHLALGLRPELDEHARRAILVMIDGGSDEYGLPPEGRLGTAAKIAWRQG